MVPDACQRAHGLKTHSGEGCLQRQREKREGRVLRHLGERGIMSGRVCVRVCVVKVDKELMVNRGEGDEGGSGPYFTVS